MRLFHDLLAYSSRQLGNVKQSVNGGRFLLLSLHMPRLNIRAGSSPSGAFVRGPAIM